MADEAEKDQKTEDATPRRRREAREKGQVALSSELLAGTMLLAAAGAFVILGPRLVDRAGELVVGGMGALGAGTEELALADAAGLFTQAVRAIAPSVLLLLAPALAVGLTVAYGQVGFQITPKAVGFDPAKIDPVKGLQRLFSLRSVVRTALSAAKITVVLVAMGGVALWHVEPLSRLGGGDMGPVLAAIGYVLLRCVAAGILAILVLALADAFFQRYQHEVDLRMTRKEVRDELKATDGDPHVKSRIRQVQRDLARRRMMTEVPKATVVVTNPTHFAVALRYDREAEGGAPYVVAKGIDRVALRIREIAREAGVPCYEDPPLARALHASVEIGDPIPEQLFQAVAGVLAYVYRLRGVRVGAGSGGGAR